VHEHHGLVLDIDEEREQLGRPGVREDDVWIAATAVASSSHLRCG